MRFAALVVLTLTGVLPAAAQDVRAPGDAPAIEAVLWGADGGSVIERHELGGDYEINTYRVVAAKRLSTTRVEVEVLFKPGSEREQEQRLILDVEKDTRRTIFNQIAGGKVVVRDGVVAGHKVRTPVLKKCG